MQFLKKIAHIVECVLAEVLMGFPTRKINVIGVTGTDGKTTTTHLIYHVIRASGYKVGMISSIYADTGDKIHETGFHTTTPRPWMVRKFLKRAVLSGCEYFVLETTSHALTQGRVWGILFQSGVITNVTHEHALHFPRFDHYLRSKVSLLLQSKRAYINRDMKTFDQVRHELVQHKKTYVTFSTKHTGAHFVWPKEMKTSLHGEYNKENIMAAYAVTSDLGVTDKQFEKALKTFKLPKGRFDVVYNKQFTIIIDFAHTPASFDQLLKSVRMDFFKQNRGSLIHIFGSASERDDLKRPMMGEVSAKYADMIILTEEDYRKEDINKIFSDIEKGIIKKGFSYLEPNIFAEKNQKKSYTKVPNRRDAINIGISMIMPHDTLVMTGKAHETTLNRGGKEEPWDEYAVVRKALKQHFGINV